MSPFLNYSNFRNGNADMLTCERPQIPDQVTSTCSGKADTRPVKVKSIQLGLTVRFGFEVTVPEVNLLQACLILLYPKEVLRLT